MRKRAPLTPLQPNELCHPKPSSFLTLNSIFQNALSVQEKVPSMEEFQAKPYFTLQNCYISANALPTERTYIQRSKTILDLFTPQNMESLGRHSEITFITGPMGTGGSYAILLYVLNQRKTNPAAVLYINNPIPPPQGKWLAYVVNEVIYAISGDLKINARGIGKQVFELGGDVADVMRSIINVSPNILDAPDYKGIMGVIHRLHAPYRQKRKPFILVFDQHAKYGGIRDQHAVTKKLTGELDFEFAQGIYGESTLESPGAPTRQNGIPTGSPFNRGGAQAYLAGGMGLGGVLYKPYCREIGILSGDDQDGDEDTGAPKGDIPPRIGGATELNPYELEVIARLTGKYPASSLSNLLDRYCLGGIPAIQKVHREWAPKPGSFEAGRPNQFIFILDNSLALTNLTPEPDPNLIYYDEKNQQWAYTSRLAKEAAPRYYKDTFEYNEFLNKRLLKFMSKIPWLLLDEKTPGRTKDDLFRGFIENTIRIAQEYPLNCYSNKSQSMEMIQIPLKYVEIRNFDHLNLQEQILQFLRQKKVQVLIPTDPNFPEIDFIIVDARNDQNQLIYLLQITINVKNHEKSDVFYQHERTKLRTRGTKETQLISQVMHKIHEENKSVVSKFIWVGGDDIDVTKNVQMTELLKDKHEDSYVTLTRVNPQLAKFFN